MDEISSEERWSDAQLLLTAEEAAKALNVGRTTLYALLKDGQLHSVHIGRSCRLTRAELMRYVERLDRPATAPTPLRPRRRAENSAAQVGLFEVGMNPDDAA
jgi:excisionase family DNA binding protein